MILLDTHIWVRWVDALARPLPSGVVATIETGDQLAISAISCWEVTWLVRRGRLDLKLHLTDWLDQALAGSDVMCLPIDRRVAVRAAGLPEHHRDPADRLIIATAIVYGARLVSLDGAFSPYFESPGTLIGS